jgi:molybdate transport system permease protein
MLRYDMWDTVADTQRRPSNTRGVAASRGFRVVLFLALAVVLTFLTLPVVAIFVDSSPGTLLSSLGEEGALEALKLSFLCTSIAIAIIVVIGTPAAYLLATRRFRGRATVVTLIELPLVMPPAVAGIGLLAALGPTGILGGVVSDLGLELVLTTTGVVLALVFVASPFYLRQAQSAFEAVDPTWLDASRTLGASEARTLFAIAIPAAGAGLVSGLALAWGRALGEFGATLMFAGSFRGITQTVPLAIYERFANDFDSALALSAVLVAVSAALLLSIKLLTGMTWLGAAR